MNVVTIAWCAERFPDIAMLPNLKSFELCHGVRINYRTQSGGWSFPTLRVGSKLQIEKPTVDEINKLSEALRLTTKSRSPNN